MAARITKAWILLHVLITAQVAAITDEYCTTFFPNYKPDEQEVDKTIEFARRVNVGHRRTRTLSSGTKIQQYILYKEYLVYKYQTVKIPLTTIIPTESGRELYLWNSGMKTYYSNTKKYGSAVFFGVLKQERKVLKNEVSSNSSSCYSLRVNLYGDAVRTATFNNYTNTRPGEKAEIIDVVELSLESPDVPLSDTPDTECFSKIHTNLLSSETNPSQPIPVVVRQGVFKSRPGMAPEYVYTEPAQQLNISWRKATEVYLKPIAATNITSFRYDTNRVAILSRLNNLIYIGMANHKSISRYNAGVWNCRGSMTDFDIFNKTVAVKVRYYTITVGNSLEGGFIEVQKVRLTALSLLQFLASRLHSG